MIAKNPMETASFFISSNFDFRPESKIKGEMKINNTNFRRRGA